MRNVIGIIFYVIAGFFTYMVCLLAFFNFQDGSPAKYGMLAGFCAPLLIFLLLAIFIYQGHNWKTATGITLFSGSTFNLLVVYMFISIKNSPELAKNVPMDGINMFSDYLTGSLVMSVFAGVGALLFYLGHIAKTAK